MPRFGAIFEKQFSVLCSQEKVGASFPGKSFGFAPGGLFGFTQGGAANSVEVLRIRVGPALRRARFKPGFGSMRWRVLPQASGGPQGWFWRYNFLCEYAVLVVQEKRYKEGRNSGLNKGKLPPNARRVPLFRSVETVPRDSPYGITRFTDPHQTEEDDAFALHGLGSWEISARISFLAGTPMSFSHQNYLSFPSKAGSRACLRTCLGPRDDGKCRFLFRP